MTKRGIVLLVLSFFGGASLMMMELVFPKIAMVWFGNMLEVWSAMLISALLSMAIGYRLGSKIVATGKSLGIILPLCYVFAGLMFYLLPHFNPIFESLLGLSSGIGSLIAALIVLLPSIGVLAISSPILISFLEKDRPDSALKSSWVFGTSTIAGVLVILALGLYIIPYLGIAFASTLAACAMLMNAILAVLLPRL